MSKIYLIRHGQTDSNNSRQFQGRIDNPLNAKGVLQAKKLAECMADIPLDAIYCSSMLRAKMTAAPIAMSHNLPYKAMDLLMEVSFGEWEGHSYAEINEKWPEEMAAFFNTPGQWIPPNGESFQQVQKRCDKALAEILAKEGNEKNIAIVSHGGIVRVQLCSLLGIPLDNLWKLSNHNASLTVLSNYDGNLIVELVNDYHFL